MTNRLRHICEACDRDEILTPEEAYQQGWDYPPKMGAFGVVSPRTCPDCTVDKTVYWMIITHNGDSPPQLDERQMAIIQRIRDEPGSIELKCESCGKPVDGEPPEGETPPGYWLCSGCAGK